MACYWQQINSGVVAKIESTLIQKFLLPQFNLYYMDYNA